MAIKLATADAKTAIWLSPGNEAPNRGILTWRKRRGGGFAVGRVSGFLGCRNMMGILSGLLHNAFAGVGNSGVKQEKRNAQESRERQNSTPSARRQK